MIDYKKEFDEAIMRITTYTNADDNRQKEYTQGLLLYPREMHTLELVFDNEDINATGLSRLTGLPKGTISRMMKKLEELSLIEIYKHKDNFKEVHYRVTERGRDAHKAHTQFHQVYGREFYESFDLLPERTKAVLVSTLNEYADYMKSYSSLDPVDINSSDEGEDEDGQE